MRFGHLENILNILNSAELWQGQWTENPISNQGFE